MATAHVDDLTELLWFEDLHDVHLVLHSYAGVLAGPVAEQAGERLASITPGLTPALGSVAATSAAPGLIYQTTIQQATLMAFVDDFRLMAILCFLCVPAVFIFRRPKRHAAPPAGDRDFAQFVVAVIGAEVGAEPLPQLLEAFPRALVGRVVAEPD